MRTRFYAYMVRCADGSLYAGYAADVLDRVHVHNSGKGSKYVYSRRPAALVWSRAFGDRSSAMREEARVKALPRRLKEEMVRWPCPTRSLAQANVLLHLYHQALPPPPEGTEPAEAEEWSKALEKDPSFYDLTRHAASRYAWGIPTESALRKLAALGPVVEMGAGSGYWAKLLRMVGANVVAFDEAPTWSRARGLQDQNMWMKMGVSHSRPRRGGPKDLVPHRDRVLFLCWPPKDEPMALESLRAWGGDTLALVGPRRYVACDDFYDELVRSFVVVDDEPLPSWPDCEDSMQVWRRRV